MSGTTPRQATWRLGDGPSTATRRSNMGWESCTRSISILSTGEAVLARGANTRFFVHDRLARLDAKTSACIDSSPRLVAHCGLGDIEGIS